MDRLTKRDEFGNADIIGVDSMDLQCNLEFDEFNRVTNAMNRLAEYEDVGTVEDFKKALKNVRTLSSMYEKLRDQEVAEFHKLAEYEDIGLTPEQLLQVDEMYADRCREIAGLERKIGIVEGKGIWRD